MKQTGGILINGGASRRDAFMFFLENSSSYLFSHETYGGILFRVTLNMGVTSPYSTNRSNAPNMEVRELMVKLLLLNENNKRFEISSMYKKTIVDLHPTTQLNFMLELERQMDAYNRSLHEETPSVLEPICPSIVIGTLLDNTSIIDAYTIISIMHRNTNSGDITGKYILSTFVKELTTSKTSASSLNVLSRKDYRGRNTPFKFGLIAMESMTTYMTAIRASSTVSKILLRGMMLFELWRLYKLGYLHGDPHFGNFLFDPNYKYFNKVSGRVIIIDFGYSFKHNLPDISVENMVDIAKISLETDGPDVQPGSTAKHSSYQWLKLNPREEVRMRELLKELFLRREHTKLEFRENVLRSTTNAGNIFTSAYISRYLKREQENSDVIARGININKSKRGKKGKGKERGKGRGRRITHRNKKK